MEQPPEEIERHIRETRARLEQNVTELREQIRARLDWRTQMQRHPLTSTVVPFAVGLLLSVMIGRAVMDMRHRAKSRALLRDLRAGRRPPVRSARLASWDELIDTLIAVGPRRARVLLNELLPALKSFARR